jgi:DNA-binding transcriptional MocR family regulator
MKGTSVFGAGFPSRLRRADGHLHQQLRDAIERQIVDGRVGPGARLPPERALAERFGISRNTVVAAYRDLEAKGLVRAYVGRGTFVCATPEPGGAPFAWRGKVAEAAGRMTDQTIRELMQIGADRSMISFAAGVPALEAFPVDTFERLVHDVLSRDALPIWRHAPTEGLPRLRKAIAARSDRRGRSVLVLSGAQHGLDLIARCLIDPGDAVIMDRPGYLGAIQALRGAGARLIGWDLARERLDELEDLILRYRPKLLYTNPTFQNPTGYTLPLGSRRDLLKLAQRYRLPVIEDGTYQDLWFTSEPPPSLFQLDTNDVVIHLNTFSKILAPGLRLGWIAAAPAIIEQLALIKQRSDPHTQNLMQEVIGRMIEEGALDDHLKALRREHWKRWLVLEGSVRRHARGHLRLSVPTGGLYSWARLGPAHDARVVSERARAMSVAFVCGDVFYPDEGGSNQVRICFSSVTPERCEDGIARLGQCLQEPSVVRSRVRVV